MSAEAPDQWSRWVLEHRDGGDERQREVTLEHLAYQRDRILTQAGPLDGATVLDVGAGDGLVGLEALARVGPRGQVIFSDVSLALLERIREVVESQGALRRAQFLAARAEELADIADGSVDVVTTRAVLIYVADKARAFSAMHRVLRPGGRLSLFEPINRLMFPEPTDRFWGYDVSAVAGLAEKVKASFDQLEASTAATMMDFDDRDLAHLAESVGFERVHVECHIDVEPGSLMRAISLDALLDSSPNPLAPSVREAVAAALTEVEQTRFLAELGRAVAQRNGIRRSAVAYLTAEKKGTGSRITTNGQASLLTRGFRATAWTAARTTRRTPRGRSDGRIADRPCARNAGCPPGAAWPSSRSPAVDTPWESDLTL